MFETQRAAGRTGHGPVIVDRQRRAQQRIEP
jgi:hypothetical protein